MRSIVDALSWLFALPSKEILKSRPETTSEIELGTDPLDDLASRIHQKVMRVECVILT